jgi:hypothetical protein
MEEAEYIEKYRAIDFPLNLHNKTKAKNINFR